MESNKIIRFEYRIILFYSYTVPRCNPPRFPDEAIVIHPRKMPKKFKHSDTILLKCKDGYFKSGIGALKCKKGDIWTGGITCSREFLLCSPYTLTKHVFLEESFVFVVQRVYTRYL